MQKNIRETQWPLKRSIFLLVLALLFTVGTCRIIELHQLQQQVAGKVLRFHVLANSNSAVDQELKLAVRDQVGAYIGEQIATAQSIDESRQIVSLHLDEIQSCAEEVIKKQGFDYSVNVSLADSFFPEKTYGSAVFPPGEYQALRVVIGEGQGRNWWCVLYPNLCFSGHLYQVDEASESEELQKVLAPEEYKLIMEEKNYQISFRFLELLEKRSG